MFQKQLIIFSLILFGAQILQAQKTTTPPKPPAPTYPQYAQPPDLLGELREGWNLSLGMNMGASELFHKIDFQRTPLHDAYEFIRSGTSNSDYEWETFVEDYDLQSTILQPRFGFSGTLTYGEIPAFLTGEFISSTSGFQKMSFSAMLGLNKDFLFGESSFFSIKSGYKIVFQDAGFGYETLVNSIGNDDGRKFLSRFFNPSTALGSPRGDMMGMRIGMGKYLGKDRKTCMGLEAYGELDLTNETLRIARMNTLGLNFYVNFVLF